MRAQIKVPILDVMRRLFRFARLGPALFFALAGPVSAAPHRVGNSDIAIELDLSDGIRVVGITPPGGTGPVRGTLFEYFPRCVSTADWCSNRSQTSDNTNSGSPKLAVDPASVSTVPSGDLLRFSADAPADHLRFDLTFDARRIQGNPGIILHVLVRNTVATPDGWAGPWDVTAAGSAPPGSNIAALRRSDDQVDAFYVNRDGALATTYSVNNGAWSSETRLYPGHDGAFVAGGPVAVARRGFTYPEVATPDPRCLLGSFVRAFSGLPLNWNATWDGCAPACPQDPEAAPIDRVQGCTGVSLTQARQVDVFTVDPRDGRIWSSFELLDSVWSDPIPLYDGPRGLFPAGAHLFALRRSAQMRADDATHHDEILDVFAVGIDGHVHVTSERGGSAWSAPKPIPGGPSFKPGAPVAALKWSEHRVDVFCVGRDGRIWGASRGRDRNADLTWGEWRDWSPFAPLGSLQSSRALGSSFLAAVREGTDFADVFAFSDTGALLRLRGDSGGGWQGPVPVTGAVVDRYSSLTAFARTDERIDVHFVDPRGDLEIVSFDETGMTGPSMVRKAFAPSGATLAALVRTAEGTDVPDQADLLAIGGSGSVRVTSDLYGRTFLRMVLPKIHGLTTLPGVFGVVPDEIGGVAGFDYLHKDFTQPPGVDLLRSPRLGAAYTAADARQGLPGWMNSMELAVAYSLSRGGLFFFDMGGDVDLHVPPIQFSLNKLYDVRVEGESRTPQECGGTCDELVGFWVRLLPPGGYALAPPIGIGVIPPGNDWHVAADAYKAVHPPKAPLAPDWLRKAGAIYTFGQGGAGGIFLDSRGGTCPGLPGAYPSFDAMAGDLIGQANDLGTNVVYLWDYWEKGSPTRDVLLGDRYFHKGDYRARADLGGEVKLRQAIATIHASKGKVILYVESLLVSEGQRIANQNLAPWAGRDLDCPRKGLAWKAYGGCDLGTGMLAPTVDWQDQLVAIAEKLVGWGADGIFLDSGGFHMNRTKRSDEEELTYGSKAHSQGVLAMIDRVRSAVRRIKPDAVVLVETISGPAGWHADGGTSSDFFSGSWPHGETEIQGVLRGSPARYAYPGKTWFSNGSDIAQLRQVFAAGHSLALSGNCAACACKTAYVFDNRVEIRQLVKMRHDFADALVDGAQEYQPGAVPNDVERPVVGYYYRGSSNRIVTAANTNTAPWAGTLQLAASEAGSVWTILPTAPGVLPSPVTADSSARLPLSIEGGGLRVLRRVGP